MTWNEELMFTHSAFDDDLPSFISYRKGKPLFHLLKYMKNEVEAAQKKKQCPRTWIPT